MRFGIERVPDIRQSAANASPTGLSLASGLVQFLLGLALLILVILLIVALIRHLRGCHPAHAHMPPPPQPNPAALNILDERYARGELSDEEYAAKKAELRKSCG